MYTLFIISDESQKRLPHATRRCFVAGDRIIEVNGTAYEGTVFLFMFPNPRFSDVEQGTGPG